MPEILIYSTSICPFCIMAKHLLETKGVHYQEINVGSSPSLREEMMIKTKRKTVPQFYIGNHHIGGYDELYDLDKSGQLDNLLDLQSG